MKLNFQKTTTSGILQTRGKKTSLGGISYTLKGRSDGGLKNCTSETTKWCRYFWHRSVFLNDDVDTAAADDDVEEMGQTAFG